MDAGTDLAGFKAFEAEGWSRKAATYDRLTGLATARLIEPLLDSAEVRAGTLLLDVGCGPGHIAAAAARRAAEPVGLDAAPGMLEQARRRYPEIEFHQGDAERLPFGDVRFDAVVAGCVVNHLPHPDRAVTEFVRVLRHRGKLAVTVWDRPERMRLIGVLAEALHRTEGVQDPGLPGDRPDPYRFADDATFSALLMNAGLEDVEVRTIEFEQRVAGIDELWEGMLGSTVRTATLVERQPAHVARRVRAALEEVVAPHRTATGISLPVTAKLGSGRRP